MQAWRKCYVQKSLETLSDGKVIEEMRDSIAQGFCARRLPPKLPPGSLL